MSCPLKHYKSTLISFPGSLTADCILPSFFNRTKYTMEINLSCNSNNPFSITMDYPSLILLSDIICSLLISSSSSQPFSQPPSHSTSSFTWSYPVVIAINHSIATSIRLTNQQTTLQADLIMETLSTTLIDQSLHYFSLESLLSIACEDLPAQVLSPQYFPLSIHYAYQKSDGKTGNRDDNNSIQTFSLKVGDIDISCTSHTISLLSNFLDFLSIFPVSPPCIASPLAGSISSFSSSNDISLQNLFPSSSPPPPSSLLLDIKIQCIRLQYVPFCAFSLHTVCILSHLSFLDFSTVIVIVSSFP